MAVDLGEIGLAHRAADLFVEGSSGDPAALFRKVGVLEYMGAYGEALALLRTLPPTVPDAFAYALARGTLTISTGDTGEARQWLEEALRHRPGSGSAWHSLALLVDFAEVMRTTVEGHALCVRYGGEEFLILRRDSTQPAPEVLADALLQQIRRRRLDWVRGGALHYTASIGIARGTPGEPIEILIRRADQALYRAKAGGRDRRDAG